MRLATQLLSTPPPAVPAMSTPAAASTQTPTQTAPELLPPGNPLDSSTSDRISPPDSGSALQPVPLCSEVFDLDAEPQTYASRVRRCALLTPSLPRDLRIYLSALCGPETGEKEGDRVRRGLSYLKERRAQGRG